MSHDPTLPDPQSLELSQGEVRIRPYRLDDVDALHQAARESVPELHPWLPWCHPGYVRADSVGWVESRSEAWLRREDFSFVILEGERFAGGVGLNRFDWPHRCADLGYWVRSGYTGRGLATAATRLAARFAFERLRLGRCQILMSTENLASRRVAEKAGARREALLERRLWLHGRWHDALLYALLSGDPGG